MQKIIFSVFFSVTFLILLGLLYMTKLNKKDVINMALNGHWQNVNPILQHTFFGDIVLSNQFNSLVELDEVGTIIPNSSKSWTINDDFTVYTFKINTTEKFSDGSNLKADDFKRSWLRSMELSPVSANNSLLDVLYKIEGYEDYLKLKDIKGIEVLDEETLKIRFKSPFRMALEYLKGLRFAAFKELSDGSLIGTGQFVIRNIDKDTLFFEINQYNKDAKNITPINLRFIESSKIVASLDSGEIDCIPFLNGTLLKDNFENEDIELITGQDSSHSTIAINHLSNKFFENERYRRAFQYLVHQKLTDSQEHIYRTTYFRHDAQVYLPNQYGYIDSNESESIILNGREFVSEFNDAISKKPLKVITTIGGMKLFEFIKSLGIPMTIDSGVVSFQQLLEVLYKSSNADLVLNSFSVSSGDPDGLYHYLGKHGAIYSPMSYFESINVLLEDGRKIIDISNLNTHYQGVTKEVLNRVPFVHLGTIRSMALFNKRVLIYKKSNLKRSVGSFSSFEIK